MELPNRSFEAVGLPSTSVKHCTDSIGASLLELWKQGQGKRVCRHSHRRRVASLGRKCRASSGRLEGGCYPSGQVPVLVCSDGTGRPTTRLEPGAHQNTGGRVSFLCTGLLSRLPLLRGLSSAQMVWKRRRCRGLCGWDFTTYRGRRGRLRLLRDRDGIELWSVRRFLRLGPALLAQDQTRVRSTTASLWHFKSENESVCSHGHQSWRQVRCKGDF